LAKREVETLDFINSNYWIGDDKGYRAPIDNYPLAVNMQSGFGGALLYLGFLSSNVSSVFSGLQSYLDKGAALARLYKYSPDLNFTDKCICASYPFNSMLVLDDNSYIWYHSGWRVTKRNCAKGCYDDLPHFGTSDYTDYVRYIEDMSHAISTLITPQVAYEINLFTHSTYPFATSDMIYFRNTFTKKLFDGNINDPGFYSAVNGTNGPIYPSTESGIFNKYEYTSLAYMPFYKFDGINYLAPTPNVYNIIMNYFRKKIYPNPTLLSGGLHVKGFADVVSAQWDKECVNLTLHNRKMIYHQDFIVKNDLEVAPQEPHVIPQTTHTVYTPGDLSFTEPIINSPEFTIESGIKVKMIAGNSIILKSGFKAKSGSSFRAFIDPSLCSGIGGQRMLITQPGNHRPDSLYGTETYMNISDTSGNKYFSNNAIRTIYQSGSDFRASDYYLRVQPNPFYSETEIVFRLKEESEVTLSIVNQLGYIIENLINKERRAGGQYKIKFEGKNYKEGLYYCILKVNGQIIGTQKMIILK
jgi:hypothetical protein